MIPNDISGVVAALADGLDELDTERADALSAALQAASDVMRIVDGFEALRGADNLPDKALIALAGIARLLVRHNFNGLAAEADTELNRLAAQIAALHLRACP